MLSKRWFIFPCCTLLSTVYMQKRKPAMPQSAFHINRYNKSGSPVFPCPRPEAIPTRTVTVWLADGLKRGSRLPHRGILRISSRGVPSHFLSGERWGGTYLGIFLSVLWCLISHCSFLRSRQMYSVTNLLLQLPWTHKYKTYPECSCLKSAKLAPSPLFYIYYQQENLQSLY